MTDSAFLPQINLGEPRLMLFDMGLGGHHGIYMQHLIDNACEQGFLGKIDIVVLPQFADFHKDTVKAIAASKNPQVNLVFISLDEGTSLGSLISRVNTDARSFREWGIFCKYAKKLQTTYALIMYLDAYALPIASGKKSPCSFSGIYFRPTFHYDTFINYSTSKKKKVLLWQENIILWQEKKIINQILRRSELHKLLCLDPFAVKSLQSGQYSAKVVHLADPVNPNPSELTDVFNFRQKMGIEQHRQVFLLFGALDDRKGTHQLLAAIKLLSSELTQNLCVLIVGKITPKEQALIQPKIAGLRQTHPVQILERYGFIPEAEVPSYFQASDVVLAPYQRHVGMSGILLLAAAAGKPVLSSNYGLMGELVMRYQLGLAIDSTIPAEIAQALSRYLLESPATFVNRSQMQLLAEQNSIELFCSTIFQCVAERCC